MIQRRLNRWLIECFELLRELTAPVSDEELDAIAQDIIAGYRQCHPIRASQVGSHRQRRTSF